MRSTARVLSVAALASATLGFAASAALADPAAEVSPSTVSPGGSVTVTVTCEPTGGEAPATIDATSEAFDEGTVQLQRVPGADEASGTSYRGTARLSGTDDLAGDAADEAVPDEPPADEAAPDGAPADEAAPGAAAPDTAAEEVAWTVEGTCPGAPGGKGKEWSATFHGGHGGGGGGVAGGGDVPGGAGHVPGGSSDVPGGSSHVPGGPSDVPGGGGVGGEGGGVGGGGGGPVQHGVQAGEGGTFTDSVPALVAGGILIAGALGAAAYRMWHRGSVPRG